MVTVTDNRAVLTLTHSADAAWPFAFEAEIDYAVSADVVTVTSVSTTVRPNQQLSVDGLHPYLPRKATIAAATLPPAASGSD